ncbi:MAG: sugar phosphate isomerase/epimerase family protein [Pseudomonadota bacterium]
MSAVLSTGFNTGMTEGDLSVLDRRLDQMVTLGCTGAEITAIGLDAVVSCRLLAHRVAALSEIMGRYELAYSLHAPIAVNLMDRVHADIMQRAALVSMDLAAEIGAKVVVFHPGRVHPRDWLAGRDGLLQFELDQLGPVADRAAEHGIQIAYENISPNARVIALEETSYSLDPRALAEQLARLDHAAVMACLDISHAQQGAGLWGFDMIEACIALAPWIGHIHFSDSTGVPATFPTGSRTEQHYFGVGDMHAPQGLGGVDFEALAQALTVLPDTRVVIEIKRNFLEHAEAETLQAAAAFGARLRTAP